MKRLWFKAKTYGFGWYPSTGEGWIILGIYLLLFVLLIREVNSQRLLLPQFLSLLFTLTLALLFVCYATGEKPRWRWGK